FRCRGACSRFSAISRFLSCSQFLLAHDGLNAGHVFAQTANLLQALCLPHLELELQPEELVIQLALLVLQLGIGHVSNLFSIHCFLLLSDLSSVRSEEHTSE